LLIAARIATRDHAAEADGHAQTQVFDRSLQLLEVGIHSLETQGHLLPQDGFRGRQIGLGDQLGHDEFPRGFGVPSACPDVTPASRRRLAYPNVSNA
jgi:hypothetical protein